MRVGRPARWAALVVAVVGVALFPATPAAAAKPTVTPAERAAAIAAPAMVNIEVTWVGWVRNKTTGALVDDQSVTVTTHCGGFGVSTDGYLVTAGQCVDLASVSTMMLMPMRLPARGFMRISETAASTRRLVSYLSW